MQALTILGSTGSIGTSTLDVVRTLPHEFRVFALAAGRNTELLARQIFEFRPSIAVVPSESQISQLRSSLSSLGLDRSDWPELLAGPDALVQISTAHEVKILLSAIVGVAGMEATFQAAQLGKRIALANKETLVSAGQLVMDAVRRSGAELIPVDSEHNGAHQCLRAGKREEARKLILTASGGPFRNTPAEDLAFVTPAQALRHPTWKMGNRITIDSATLMNKGFEVIEACWLFDFSPVDVEVVVHPQSSVHAMLEYNDGSVLAQISATDMRMPIQYALTYPERAAAPVPRIDWAQSRTWDFAAPDYAKFPLLRLAYQAMETGGTAGCTLNAADEIAVEAFLNDQIAFLDISTVVEETLQKVAVRHPLAIGDILSVDEESRNCARQIAATRSRVARHSHIAPMKA
jgi:1-deoxy-D-xylulose-5-phosphate reductoisomerase